MKIESFFSGKLNIHMKQSKKASAEKPWRDRHQDKDFRTYAFDPSKEVASALAE